MVVSQYGGLSPGWYLTWVVSHQGGPSLWWSLITVISHQGALASGWSLISMVFDYGVFSSGWSVIKIVSHLSGLSSGWSFIRVVSQQCGLSSGVPLCYLTSGKLLAVNPTTYWFEPRQDANVASKVDRLEDCLAAPLKVQVDHQGAQGFSNFPGLVLHIPPAKTEQVFSLDCVFCIIVIHSSVSQCRILGCQSFEKLQLIRRP